MKTKERHHLKENELGRLTRQARESKQVAIDVRRGEGDLGNFTLPRVSALH